jgi:hypothetical protein
MLGGQICTLLSLHFTEIVVSCLSYSEWRMILSHIVRTFACVPILNKTGILKVGFSITLEDLNEYFSSSTL